jgi:cAMP-dependent protein kinase regulator
MAKKNKLLANIEDYKGGDGVDVWSNVRATTIDVDHTTYEAPKNLPEPTPQEEALLMEAMEQSVLFHPHRDVKDTQSALVHAFEKFEIQEGEEFIQSPEDNFFYVVKEGTVDFQSNGKVVGTAQEGEHFGELNLLYAGDPSTLQHKRKFNLVARENSTLMRLNQAVFREILQVQTKLEEDVKKDYLKKVPFLRNLLFNGEVDKNKQTTSRLISIMITKKFKEGAKILDDGSDPEDSLFIIKEGKVQLTSDKKEVFHLAAGSYIGKRALMASKGKEPNVQDLEGLSDGTLYQIEKDAVNKVLGQNFFARQFDVAQDKKKLVRLFSLQNRKCV